MALAAVQAVVLRQYCRLCLLIDGAAMLLAVTELAWPPAEPATPPRLWPWIVALVPAVAGPLAVSRFAFAEPGVPAEVLALQRSGQVTVVFVTDFECKQCRAAHPMLRRLVEEHSPRARLVMFVFPLPAHQHSRDAALAYFAAERMGKGPAMAEALVAADDLSARGCEKLAEKLGLEAGKFREHVSSREAEERLGEAGWLKKAGVPGLPAVWVGTKKFSGALEEEALREAFEAQLAAGGGG
jgi:predicted DsbA family dithiol-disulfide isomerase